MNAKVNIIMGCVISLLLDVDCASQKTFVTQGGIDDAIHNSVNDFAKTRFFRAGKVFAVSFEEEFKRYQLRELDKGTYKWEPARSFRDFFAINIVQYDVKFLYDSSEIGKFNATVPTVAFKKDGKLFYWWDKKRPLTKETVATLLEFGLIEMKSNELNSGFKTDDSQKAVHYFICKNDLSEYKRVITNKGLGYYDPPNLKCH